VDLVRRTIELTLESVENGGRPFACVISRGDEVVSESPNLVAQTQDPTAHAEIVAIRQACQWLGTENPEGHAIYVLAHPCPMCLGALYYCSPDRVVFTTTRDEYSQHYEDDRKYFELENFYDEFSKQGQERRLPMEHRPDEEGVEVYRRWRESNS
jgi:guanine deaminase